MAARPGCVRALMTTVVVLGILLVGGLAVVIATIVQRVTSGSETGDAMPSAGSVAPSFSSHLSVPDGAALLDTRINDRHIVLHLRDAEGDFLLLLNVKNGQEIGRVRLTAD